MIKFFRIAFRLSMRHALSLDMMERAMGLEVDGFYATGGKFKKLGLTRIDPNGDWQ